MNRATWLVGLFLSASGACRALAETQPPSTPPTLQESDDIPFNNTKTPLNDKDFLLLSENGYRVQPDGTVRAPGSTHAIGQSEITYILDELAGRQRMKAMLQLNMIFNQYGTKNIPADPLEELRRIGRQNWSVLPDRVRTDLRAYYSPRELEALDSGIRPVRVPQTWLPLEAPGAYSVADSTTSTQPEETAENNRPAGQAQSAISKNALDGMPLSLSEQATMDKILHDASTPSAAAIPTASGGAAPSLVKSMQTEATNAVSSAVAAGAPPVVSTKPFAVQTAPAEPTAAPAAIAQAPAMTPPVVPAAAPTPPRPPVSILSTLNADYPEFSQADFEKFLADAPYNRDIKALLTKISEHAPTEARHIALGVIAKHLPQVSVDPLLSAKEMYGRMTRVNLDPNLPSRYSIALNPGPLLFSSRKMLFSSKESLVPAATDYFQTRGALTPAVQAIAQESPAAKTLISEWGLTRKFDDGSRRLLYTPEQMAGTLLYHLLALDASMRRLDVDPHRAELRARFYQFVFYRKLKEETGVKPLLDRNLQTEYDEWLERPNDYWDTLAQALAAPLRAAIAPDLSGSAESRDSWRKNADQAYFKQTGLSGKIEPSGEPKAVDFVTAPSETSGKIVWTQLRMLEGESTAGKEWLAEEGKFRDSLHEKK